MKRIPTAGDAGKSANDSAADHDTAAEPAADRPRPRPTRGTLGVKPVATPIEDERAPATVKKTGVRTRFLSTSDRKAAGDPTVRPAPKAKATDRDAPRRGGKERAGDERAGPRVQRDARPQDGQKRPARPSGAPAGSGQARRSDTRDARPPAVEGAPRGGRRPGAGEPDARSGRDRAPAGVAPRSPRTRDAVGAEPKRRSFATDDPKRGPSATAEAKRRPFASAEPKPRASAGEWERRASPIGEAKRRASGTAEPKRRASAPAEPQYRPSAAPRPAPSRPADDAPEGVRLSKVMAERGLCSRREADAIIERGWVFVDGQRVSELGIRIDPNAEITLAAQAKRQQAEQVTILLHKPVGYVSGQPEPGFEPAVSLIGPDNQFDRADAQRFHSSHLKGLAPAGRLDIDSTGLLVLTQDGRIARQLIGDDSKVDKEYLVRVEGELDEHGLALLNHGLELDDRKLRPAKVEWINEDQLRFVLREGRKRQIRRMCELVGLRVTGLKRIRIGRVRLGDLPLGQWRFLREDELF